MSTPRPVLVVDFGAQYAQLIARRVREARVYSEIVPHSMPVAEMLAREPKAIILSGGPSSVYAEGAPGIDDGVFTAGVPVFGMCYGFQLMASALGGTVAHTGDREYGRTDLHVTDPGRLHGDLPEAHPVWMSHGDGVTRAPEGFTTTASSSGAPVAAFEDVDRRLAGVQYHPEVGHSPHGQLVLERLEPCARGEDPGQARAFGRTRQVLPARGDHRARPGRQTQEERLVLGDEARDQDSVGRQGVRLAGERLAQLPGLVALDLAAWPRVQVGAQIAS